MFKPLVQRYRVRPAISLDFYGYWASWRPSQKNEARLHNNLLPQK